MDAPLRWGLLSTARINNAIVYAARVTDAADVVAVASRDGGKAREAAAQWEIETAYPSYEALLAAPDIDAVYNPLPNGMHHRWTLAALEAGKHVLCEKPYSSRPADVVEAFDLADERGLVLSEAFMYRYHPQTVAVAQAVADGAIGELRLISASFSFLLENPADIRLDPALDGGALMDVGVYPVSAARLLAGTPTSVTAAQVVGGGGVDVSFVATMTHEHEVLTHLDASFAAPLRSSLEAVGTQGVIRVADPWHASTPGFALARAGHDPEQVEVPTANSYALELEAFARAVRGHAPSGPALLGRDDALAQARTVAALLTAAASETSAVP